jgi:hypothetical protein
VSDESKKKEKYVAILYFQHNDTFVTGEHTFFGQHSLMDKTQLLHIIMITV